MQQAAVSVSPQARQRAHSEGPELLAQTALQAEPVPSAVARSAPVPELGLAAAVRAPWEARGVLLRQPVAPEAGRAEVLGQQAARLPDEVPTRPPLLPLRQQPCPRDLLRMRENCC
jgi:hypothetical protein